MTPRSSSYLADLVRRCCALAHETEWVEFKRNYSRPEAVGEYISALANSAALHGEPFGYVFWGVRNSTHDLVGTDFVPGSTKKGNELIEPWLARSLEPQVDFRFEEVEVDGARIVLLRVPRATSRPVAFKRTEFIRLGSPTRRLRDHPAKETELWRLFLDSVFEDGVSAEHLDGPDVLQALDYPAYFQLLEVPPADGREAILQALTHDRLIRPSQAGGYDITNLGAILFARRLADFPELKRKAVRLIHYRGSGRMDVEREQEGGKGYATGFGGLVSHIRAWTPSNEELGPAFRREVPMFPPIAIRELVANALIHQDFSMTGAGPMIEIFDRRLEISNPGEPLMDTSRLLDTQPHSRNERLASLMRRLNICEERGSGIDKVVHAVESYALPAPVFERPPGFTRAILFAHKPLREMDRQERLHACYMHACLRYVTQQPMTNSSLRARFGIADRNASMASRILADAVNKGLIAVADPETGPRARRYLPFWAGS
ncbi:MAG: putative DNA binding domain-containing protein [Gemmatimonadota bacterium]|uniref:ATP-binding protein n=1 Tax=Candidatus Palauibacter scopulicola TaxID=3056741 RepID=UPI00239627BF|nr:ATP-binding protein [Candidatus Palauibacter scopulicola]MDE2664368.1 putative DNA binding domain-containing protein [Candidatus Palauibacter scopulicola]